MSKHHINRVPIMIIERFISKVMYNKASYSKGNS